ncbi:hypothetical protein KR054_006812 [Drosophila jambulina]|nr:hypothetical protein KR054_006812 [Drosophila jambulina]
MGIPVYLTIYRNMFLSRSLFMASQLKQQQRWLFPERKLSSYRRPLSVEFPERARNFNRTDLKRPPLLLVKSFFNLRRRDTDHDEDISRVTDELTFRPHRLTFVDLLHLPYQRTTEMDSNADGETSDMMLPEPDPLAIPES